MEAGRWKLLMTEKSIVDFLSELNIFHNNIIPQYLQHPSSSFQPILKPYYSKTELILIKNDIHYNIV
ncbi:hypothetical protein DRF65_13000 [Chryseobacterium pennae]|uniref:Uncharacterized protein n=1 Tax=Chryseobacterium pennae TaxID=2258962 RepID=A0A3D9C862_9FLAO|nr:hypothetical protein DRF65_13000 [Chryseobacterium pennae]